MTVFNFTVRFSVTLTVVSLLIFAGQKGVQAEAARMGRTFDVVKSGSRIADIDRTFFLNYESGVSPWYGRVWRDEFAKKNQYPNSEMTVWQHFRQTLAENDLMPQRLDCTLYANEILKAGMSKNDYRRLWAEHRKIWGPSGLSGWSVGHLLTEKFGWRAYAVIHPEAPDYSYYMSYFQKKHEYPVWRQPNIRIEKYFISGQDVKAIEGLLTKHPFGWGFSEGGIHTWIVTGTDLKECHFDSGPMKRYDANNPHRLLETTPFTQFHDYNVHLIVFPPDA